MPRLSLRALASALLLILGLASGCAESASAPAAPEATVVQSALALCMDGQASAGLDTLAAALTSAPDWPDALAVRGLCRWSQFAADSSRADLDAAHADLSAAIDGFDAWTGEPVLSLDRLHNHRAFAAQARGDGWDAVLSDLDAAHELAPDNLGHRFDRGLARAYAGDSTGARADLDAFLADADSADADRRAFADRTLADLATR